MTSVVERRRDYTAGFDTHPMEVGWAREAIFFVTAEEVEGVGATLHARVQLSADGVTWVDEGTAFEPLEGPGTAFVRVTHFGGWLRLAGAVEGAGARFRLTVRLVLKE